MTDDDNKPYDEELYNMMKCASKTLQRVKASKKELKGAQRKSRRKVAALKEARNTEYSITEEARARINKTYADLELNAKAEAMSVWCATCECIHADTLLSDHPLPPLPLPSSTQSSLLDNLSALLDKMNRKD